ncbi:MAG: hypothetical protein E6300_07220 [Clostridium sp.]|uniref:hypothetical protein n=1 Tax=Clostridium sp. TaxID=1506 RepID=UPI00290FD7D9|nr:hypothetical protein [Clostridium sp.]MDU7148264.1 hypothetical protein [Clostridium sp.]
MKKKTLLISGISLVLIIGFLSYLSNDSVVKEGKTKIINTLVEDYRDNKISYSDVAGELGKYREDESIKYKHKEAWKAIDEINEGRDIYENTVGKRLDYEDINEMTDSSKEHYIEVLSKVTANSEYFDKCKTLIAQLKGEIPANPPKEKPIEKETKYLFELLSYSKHYQAGSQKLEIKVKNTSGKDISYLAIDIFEVSTQGEILNSDYTNTNSLVKDGATVVLDTYFKYQRSDSDLKFEIRDVRYK